MKTPQPLLILGCLGLLGAGCIIDPFRSSFRSTISEKVPKGESGALETATGDPRLLSSQDMKADSIKLLENGYWPVGNSRFTGQFVEASVALSQAKAVGAEVVVVLQTHVGTGTYSIPVLDWVPDRRVTVSEQTQTRNADGSAAAFQYHDSVATVQGEYQTHYEMQTQETFEQSAVYWKKAADPILGILASDLGENERAASSSNKGVVVKLLIRKSPAFMGDVFRGDIVRRMAGHEVLGAEDFFQLVQANAGKTVELQLWRSGALVNKSILLAR
jgi:hypothetical protein